MKFLVFASILSAGVVKYANAACAGPYAQCGGNNFTGETCCQSGYKCVAMNEWYSQCQEDPSGSVSNNSAADNQWNNNGWNNNNNNNQWNNNQWGNNENGWNWENNNNNQWNNNGNNNWNNNNNGQSTKAIPNNGQSNAKTLPITNSSKTIPANGGNSNNDFSSKTIPANGNGNNDFSSKTLPGNGNNDFSSKTLPGNGNNITSKTVPANGNQNTNVPQSPPQMGGGSGSSQNFFLNEIYANPRFIEEIDSSIPKLSGDLAAKAEKVKQVPTAVWLAWDGAPGEVEGHLAAAGSKTVVFLLYMIPTRDCNSLASAGGASSLEKYKGYIDDISNTIRSHPESKVVMVVEPDTLGNLVTGSSEACKTVHTLHKNALSYAVNVFGAMSNVSVYLDAAHGKWLGGVTDKVATVIKEILDGAPNGKIRGLSTNVSNYQPVSAEYQYHQKLAASLAAVGVNDVHFIVDTGRSGVDITESFSKTETWCNFIGTGFGLHPKGNPDASMPLLDAYMWLKTPGEADGSSTGSRADPVCAREDSLPGSPDAGQWFHDYFVQLLQNANPPF
ncbi:1,4-beta-D-glucan-cellobiohydrolase [Piromyces finnis]|uniref:Glucanase n=1 Tax=Piromyces finnis TaxID=1754191 RepID=A0A1Y1V3R9_9FUNG|nr:1,4-beta-D-glucan-cellobiohydrolase [Piromyces finnis]|eukprot:ORX46613.1 1,4-beta-D-glucan-cellobiohydrolase [Piromyces finnis]